MKSLVAFFALASSMCSAQSLHFVGDGQIPYEVIAGNIHGRLVEPRIDILRSKCDWDEYYSRQCGFGGKVVTSLIQPDFCREQVIAVNLGGSGSITRSPRFRRIRALDECTWEVTVDVFDPTDGANPVDSMFSPFLAVRTPYGPDNYRFVFQSSTSREVIELRSAPRFYALPADWWHNGHGRLGK